eukprot:scaffold503856_cov31-Prasinocladus_malaysianus.AAC.2
MAARLVAYFSGASMTVICLHFPAVSSPCGEARRNTASLQADDNYIWSLDKNVAEQRSARIIAQLIPPIQDR